MILEYVCMIFVRKKSNVNIEVIQINQVKFEHHLVMMINILSGRNIRFEINSQNFDL
jgi:hypothetical protein